MIKGCQKKIIFLKDTGCDVFEEAYFVIKNEYEGMNNGDIVSEATKIASGIYQDTSKTKSRGREAYPLILSAGMLIGALITVVCFFLFG